MTTNDLKNELKKPDEFVSIFGNLSIKIAQHQKQTLLILLGIVLVGFATFFWRDQIQKKNEKAADAFALVLEQYPNEAKNIAGSIDDPSSWNAWLSVVQEFLKEHPSSSFTPLAQVYLGRAYLHNQQFSEATEAFEKASSKLSKPGKYIALEGKALALMELERWKDAEVLWEKLSISKDNPLQAFHLWNLGLVQENQKKNSEAVRTYQELEKTFPQSSLVEKVRVRLAGLQDTRSSK